MAPARSGVSALESVDELPFAPLNGQKTAAGDDLCAGVALVDPTGAVLFLRRAGNGDHAGEWNLPGGHAEDGETLQEAAARECEEESGHAPDEKSLVPAARLAANGTDYTTYFCPVDAQFDPTLNDESTEHVWEHPSNAPEPLHPGLEAVLPLLHAGIGKFAKNGDTVSESTGLVSYDQTSASARRVRRKKKRGLNMSGEQQVQKGWSDEAREAAAEARQAKVSSKTYAGGHRVVTAEVGHSYSAIMHPDHQEQLSNLNDGDSTHFKDEQGMGWNVMRDGEKLLFQGDGKRASDNYKFNIPHSSVQAEKLAKGADAMGDQQVSFFMPFGKKEPQADGSVIVTGYASTPTKDLDGEIISLDAVKKALPSYMEWRNIRTMHQANAVGTAKEAHVDDKGLFLRARIVEPGAVNLVNEEVYKGYSIGGRKLAKTGDTVTDIELIEVSLVDRPCNPDCRFAIAKMAKDTGVEVLNAARIDLIKVVDERGLFTGPIELAPAEAGFIGSLLAKLGLGTALKRDVSDKERGELADEGHAMPDGSYPIKSEGDLQNAVQAFGRAKNKPAVKRHIIRQAKRLKATHHLPTDWPGSTKEEKGALALALRKVREAGWTDKLEKRADLYTVSQMIELLGRLEWLEECCEGEAGYCCPMGGTVIDPGKEFTDKFGTMLVEFGDMLSELLGKILAEMKAEEAQEAAEKLAKSCDALRVESTPAPAPKPEDEAAKAAKAAEDAALGDLEKILNPGVSGTISGSALKALGKISGVEVGDDDPIASLAMIAKRAGNPGPRPGTADVFAELRNQFNTAAAD